MKTIHFSVLLVALLASCAPMKSSVSTETDIRADTARHEHRLAQDAAERTTQAATTSQSEEISVQRGVRSEVIPPRTASVTVTEENLRNLPEGAAYTARDGALTLEARREGEIFRITAWCDSLARRIEYYEATSVRQSRQVDSLERCLTQAREAYDLLAETASAEQVQTLDERTRSPAHRGGWMLLGMILGAIGGWWAYKTDIIHKLIKIF